MVIDIIGHANLANIYVPDNKKKKCLDTNPFVTWQHHDWTNWWFNSWFSRGDCQWSSDCCLVNNRGKNESVSSFSVFFFVAVLFVEASPTTCCRADKQQKKNQSNIDLSWHSGIYCDCLPIGHWYSLLNWFILMRIRQNIVINAHIAYIWKCLIKINYF